MKALLAASGKLAMLNAMLKRLFADNHRVLLFSQVGRESWIVCASA